MDFISRIHCTPNTTFSNLASPVSENLQSAKVVCIEGLGVSKIDLRAFYDGLATQLGTPSDVSENHETGGQIHSRWTDVRYIRDLEDKTFRCSKTPQPLHTDGAYDGDAGDVVIMYCETQAIAGGETTFLDGAQLVAKLKETAPELFEKLSGEIFHFSKGSRKKIASAISFDELGPLLCWNYFRVNTESDAEETRMASEFRNFLDTHIENSEIVARIALRPGDAVVWHDARVLHGRRAFIAHRDNDRLLWKAPVFWKKGATPSTSVRNRAL